MRDASDPRVVLTLDAGGTTFAFSAMQGCARAGREVVLPAEVDELGPCLETITAGFRQLLAEAPAPPVAISFAFPGPADYAAGIIGDLQNLPAFRGGVALGPFLEDRFGLPVYLNNDGDLFACGEAMAGLLPEVNRWLEAAGSPKRYRNLFGVTLGTGFGGGLVQDGRLYLGDNGAGAEIWSLRGRRFPWGPAEEGVSIRAVRRAYAELAGLPWAASPEPRVLADIARGSAPGHRAAAVEAFRRLGECTGDALAMATSLLDALVVVGGGLSGAGELFLPALVEEMNAPLATPAGDRFPRMEVTAYNLEDPAQRSRFINGGSRAVTVPGSRRQVPYDPAKRVGVGLTRLGTSLAVGVGACAYALDRLDSRR